MRHPNISLCLRKGTRQGHNYYGMLIQTHVLYQMVPFLVTPNDPKPPQFQCFVSPFTSFSGWGQRVQIW